MKPPQRGGFEGLLTGVASFGDRVLLHGLKAEITNRSSALVERIALAMVKDELGRDGWGRLTDDERSNWKARAASALTAAVAELQSLFGKRAAK